MRQRNIFLGNPICLSYFPFFSFSSFCYFYSPLALPQDCCFSSMPITTHYILVYVPTSANPLHPFFLLFSSFPPFFLLSFLLLFLPILIHPSYYDVKLFLAIFNSLPAQTSSADSKRHSDAPPGNAAATTAAAAAARPPVANATAHLRSKYPSAHVSRLKELGYKEVDVLNALEENRGNLDESAQWLLDRVGSNRSTDDALAVAADTSVEEGQGASRYDLMT